MAAISREEVAHLARLSRLAVTEEELDTFAGQLDVILQSVARVGEVAAADIPPTSHSVPLTNVLREDVVVPGLTPRGGAFRRPRRRRAAVPRPADPGRGRGVVSGRDRRTIEPSAPGARGAGERSEATA